ncbi:restriction endonuclease subunit S [Mariprofundus ferrooxydans]|uniref:restriction endonuclease subunit S n=1 Tax=Mariprofundus ferrooxydans TaxID=314344 RepID=UPI00143089C4|nr:restriction endonuclease subunit S [Mariprofundus ferrooxydans]
MTSEWRELPFTEAVDINPKVKLKKGDSYPFVDMKAIDPSWRNVTESEQRAFTSGGAKFEAFDTLLARITPCLENGKIARYVPTNGSDGPAFGSTEFIVIRGKKGVTDNDFAYYLTKWQEFRQFAISQMTGSSGRQRVPAESLGGFAVPVPELSEQRVIAHILGSLDDKIELNRKMNETLEAMAQALFKSWFIDFDPVIDNALAAGNAIPEELQIRAAMRESLADARKPLPDDVRDLFPSEFEFTEEMGWIPKGWEVQVLDDLVDLTGGGTPKTSIAEYWNGEIPWFSVVDAPNSTDVFVIDTEKHVTQLGVEKSSTKILPVGTTIVSARGTVGKCALVGEPMAMNQSCYGVIGKGEISDIFVYYAIREKVADLQRSGHGSVFNTITRDTFKTIRIAFSGDSLTKKLEAHIKPSFDRILANCFHSRDLSSQRDLLIPKLLSGEIRIPKPEAMLESIL